jgi:hypothetical protein
MNSKVKVTADEAGNVIVRSPKNPDYGHIRVEQIKMIIDDSGFARKRKLSALIPGTVEDLKCFGWTKDQEVDGQIIVKDSLEPFNKKFPERDYKVAGRSGVVCCQDGMPIYRRNFYTLNMKATDIKVEHTNGDDIIAAYAALKEDEEQVMSSYAGDDLDLL